MRALIQRVSEAKLCIDELQKASIQKGLLVFLGITIKDTEADIDYLVKKILQLRIFSDDEGKMNLSLQDINGDLLLVSQFTLFASTKKGNRPSYIRSAKPEISEPLYNLFIKKIQESLGREIQTGIFGADMKINLINNGPVTIMLDSQEKDF